MDVRSVAERALAEVAKDVDVHVTSAGATVRGRRLAARSSAPPGPLPSVANDFEIVEEIGRGGMGVVELARQRSIGREVAVKRVADPEDHVSIAALMTEARVTGRLEHPNIVPVHALAEAPEGGPILVMKRIEGVPWSTLAREPSHPVWDEVRGARLVHHLRVLLSVCRAVELAHARGFLHRDIKLANVMLGRFGEVYLLDFGLAISLEEARAHPIEAIQGTPQYMAPEMLDPERPLDERADVYLLGATLHHVLTGQPRHDGPSYGAVLFAAATSAPCAHGDEVPAELAAICQRATHADPDARYPSARALREALEDYLAHRDSIELTDAARERLDELRETIAIDGDAVRVEALHREARFGFEQALRGWSENDAAKKGLRQALEEMLAHHLRKGHLEGARALASELDPLPDGARERLDELERERARERDASARLAHVEHAFDERVGQRERRITAWVVGTLILVSGGMALLAWALGFELFEREMLVAGTFVVNALLLTAAVIFRRSLMSNRFNRTMALVLGSGTVGVLLNRVEGYVLDEPFASILASDGILMAVVFAVAGALLRRAFFVGTVAFLTVSLMTGLYPAYALPILAAGGIITILAILLARGSAREPLLGRPSSHPREPPSED